MDEIGGISFHYIITHFFLFFGYKIGDIGNM